MADARWADATAGLRADRPTCDCLGAWLQVLKGDNGAIFQAAFLASKAADFVSKRPIDPAFCIVCVSRPGVAAPIGALLD
jgi:antirestriction protein ArdC